MSENAVLKERAKLQGRIFRRAVLTGLDAEKFSDAFMSSEQAKWLDSFGDATEIFGEGYILDEFLSHYKAERARVKTCSCLAEWVGSTYRMWCDSEKIPSDEAARLVPFKRMTELYPVLNAMCAQRVIEILNRQMSEEYGG